MTIKEYRESLEVLKNFKNRNEDGPALDELMLDTMDIWSNNAALGYLMIALKNAGTDKDMADKIKACMREAFGDMSVSEAEEYYTSH